MGLLDTLTGLSPEQNQGLLAAAAQMLQMSGPSRTPTSFGQAVGGGLEAYQGAMTAAQRRKQEEEQARQMAEMRALQMQEAQGGLQDREAARQQAAKLQALNAEYAGQQGQPAMPQLGAQPMASMPGQPQPTAAQQPQGEYQERMRYAQFLRSKDMIPQANAAALEALKFRDEFDTTERVGNRPDGTPFKYVIDKQGNIKELTGVLPRDEMKLADTGGGLEAYNSFALKPGQKFTKTQSPENVASVGASMANAAATREIAKATRDAATATRNQATEMKLADDYRAQSKDFKEVGNAYRQINSTLDKATTSPAATLAAATKFMKLLDPGSVVRESELGMALAASGVIDRATNYYQTLLKGRVLTPNQVKDFKDITTQIYGAAQEGQKAIDQSYRAQAQTYGLRPEMVVQDLGQNKPIAAPSPNIPRDAVNMLKMNPKLRAQFDEKYGAGAAAGVLGQ